MNNRLYELMPTVYRERDVTEGYPLRGLLGLVTEQSDILEADIERLWETFFIETCDRWAIAYIGDLVGNNLLHDGSRFRGPDTARDLFPDLAGRDLRPGIAIRTRSDVAKTIYYRRRKGTVPMLEELARDVTGWGAHAVEFFELLVWSQWVRNHLRMHSPGTAALRRIEPVDALNGPFDPIRHSVDVRAINSLDGWFNIKNMGFFLWRLRSYPIANSRAREASEPWRYHFSPLGNRAPLFSRWRREGDEAGLATELHVPGPIRRAFFHEDLATYRNLPPIRPPSTNLYGLFDPLEGNPLPASPECSFIVVRNGTPVLPTQDPAAEPDVFQPQIVCRRLDPWPAVQLAGQVVAIDVVAGRISIGDGWPDATDSVDVFYHYGFSADLGCGPYERGKWMVRPELAILRLDVREGGALPQFSTLGDALAHWAGQGKPDTIITILDNRTYAEALSIEPADNHWLAIEASNGKRPHLRPDGGLISIPGNHPGGELTLNGLLIEGGIHVTGEMRRLRLLHTTLVPGRALDEDGNAATDEASLIVESDSGGQPINATLRVEIAFSITGPLRLPQHAAGLWLLDSIIDGLAKTAVAATGTDDEPGPPTSLERVTIFGRSHFKKLDASETIFTKTVEVAQRQEGCVRFSFVPGASVTPRRYRCQPDLEIEARIKGADPGDWPAIRKEVLLALVPLFTSTHYGQPAYAQLHLVCPDSIRTGAEDESEMGAFCHLKQPQRETNLRIRLEEYLPFGLEPGFIYVT
jgi:hypothetical protein